MNNQPPRQCYFNGKLRAPTSRLSLPPTTEGLSSHSPQDHRPASDPVSPFRYLHNAPPLRTAPDPDCQAPGAGYVEEFLSSQTRERHIGATLRNRMRGLSRQGHSSFAEVSLGKARFLGVRVVAPGRVFHPFKNLYENPYGRPRYQEDLKYILIEELVRASRPVRSIRMQHKCEHAIKSVESNQKTVEGANPKQKQAAQAGYTAKNVIAHKSMSSAEENLGQVWPIWVALGFWLYFIILY